MSYHETYQESLIKRYKLRLPMDPFEQQEARELITNERIKNFQLPKPPDERIIKFHHLLDQFKKLSPQLLVAIIDELNLMDNLDYHPYHEMTLDVYQKAKKSCYLSEKQKMVLIQLVMNKH